MKILRSIGLALTAALVPLAWTAPLEAQEECTVSVMPLAVASGSVAERVAVTTSRPIGEITSFDATADSGVRLAQPSDLGRVDLASGAEPPAPIQMANEANRATLFLNTVGAEAGTYEFALSGSDGECRGTLTISPGG